MLEEVTPDILTEVGGEDKSEVEIFEIIHSSLTMVRNNYYYAFHLFSLSLQ